MGSVSFAVEDESQPSTSNAKAHKFSRTFLDGCGAVNQASIPRKLRSAIKKRGRESVTSPLLFSRKQHDKSTTVDTLRKIGPKKSRLNKKKGQITKDEEEVAETLFALAGMFSDTNKTDQRKINDEKPEIKSSGALEEGISIYSAQDTRPTLQEESRKISSKVTLESVFTLGNSTAEEVISQSKEARKLEFFSSKKAMTPNTSGGQSDLRIGSASRPLVSILGMNEGGEHEIHSNQLAASGFQYGKNCSSISDKHKDLFPPTRATSSETPKSCPRSTSGRSRGTILSSHPRVIEQEMTTGEYTRVATKSNKSWKRCSAHVYISRLIKVLQISEREEGSSVTPTQPTTSGGAELHAHARINSRNGDAHFSTLDIFHAKKDFSSEIQNGIFHKRPIQDQQMASETSAVCSSKQGYEFLLSLGTGESANQAAECFLKPPKQYHMPYLQSENESAVPCSLPRNCYSQSHNSALEAHQVQLSKYHNSNTIANSNFMQQKWAAQLQTHYYNSVSKNKNNGGIDSANASVLNCDHSLFPQLHAALGTKYQHLPPQQHQLMLATTSLPPPLSSMKQRHNLPLGFERNRGVLNPASMAQLQRLSCNQHL